ncbi:MAG: hypothetical protein JW837_00445 [Sedimentisphaerales bacterium]|nr:hypothetical protein [Sedimentisphaerales bacterium]
MPDLDAQVKNEGVRILRLCKDLSEFILCGQARKTYLYETENFLKHIEKSLKAIDDFVRQTINKKMAPPLAKVKLKELDLIREGLSWLYTFVKEAIDADTLSIPYSLTTFLNHTATQLQEPNKVSLVVLGSSDLMYYKYNLEYLRKLTNNLASIIEKYPVLPSEIGILKFPYCAAQEVLVNCILFHEMGHYIYEKTGLQRYFYNSINNNLRAFIKDQKIMEKITTPLLVQRRLFNYVTSLMLRWVDEIFADIFAIKTLGPAFHLACLELEQILRTDIKRNMNFSRTHPADYFRFKMHAKWLSEGEWDEIIKERTPLVFDRLKDCEKLQLKNNDFSINYKSPLEDKPDLENKLHNWMLQEFEKMVKKIEPVVSAELENFKNPINDFNNNDALVTDYLEHGVVPSTVYDNENKQICHPNPTTILNSGFFFYLGNMDALLKKVESSNSDIDKRTNYEKRLNQWLAKAIEDWQILLMENKL